MLLENAITRRMPDCAPDMSIECDCDEKGFKLRITNEISSEVKVKDEARKVKEIINKITVAKKSTDMVKKEGSGFYKVAKILTTDLGCEYELDAFLKTRRTLFSHSEFYEEGSLYERY